MMNTFGGRPTNEHEGTFFDALQEMVRLDGGTPMAAAVLTTTSRGSGVSFMHGSQDHSSPVTAALQFMVAKRLIESLQDELKIDQLEFLLRSLDEAQATIAAMAPCICGYPDCPNAASKG